MMIRLVESCLPDGGKGGEHNDIDLVDISEIFAFRMDSVLKWNHLTEFIPSLMKTHTIAKNPPAVLEC